MLAEKISEIFQKFPWGLRGRRAGLVVSGLCPRRSGRGGIPGLRTGGGCVLPIFGTHRRKKSLT